MPIARRLAAQHPHAMLPCPLCGVTLKAENLERHIAKTHPDFVSGRPLDAAGPIVLTGVDRRMVGPSFVLLALWCGLAAGVGSTFGRLAPVPLVLFSLTALAAFAPLALAIAGKFRATLVLEPSALTLRTRLGTSTRRLSLPAKIESGGFERRFESVVTSRVPNPKTYTKRVGIFLRLRDGSAITIGATKTASLSKRWATTGWKQAQKTERVDIELSRTALLGLEYQLAARGWLQPVEG